MSRKTPFTKVEVVEERHPNQPEGVPCVKSNKILVNGQPVRVEKDGIRIEPGDADEPAIVELRILVDEVSIRQVPNGYTEGKTSTSTGPHLRFPFIGVDMEDGKGAPVTTKIDQPRDHLGRFTKRD